MTTYNKLVKKIQEVCPETITRRISPEKNEFASPETQIDVIWRGDQITLEHVLKALGQDNVPLDWRVASSGRLEGYDEYDCKECRHPHWDFDDGPTWQLTLPLRNQSPELIEWLGNVLDV
jgi:hypothetical protein